MGFVSLDELELAVLLESSAADCHNEAEAAELAVQQAHARRVLPLVSRHHQLLVTLLLLNSLANESLPLFLDSLVPSWVAIVLSVTFLLVFAEILPSAIFTGPNGLRISASLSPYVSIAMVLTSPIALPISWVLDRWLGKHSETASRYNKSQLLALLRLHTDNSLPSPSWSEHESPTRRPAPATGLARQEARIMQGALSMQHVPVEDVMTPAQKMFMLDLDSTRLDISTMATIVYQGHSRIPVYKKDRHHIVGILLTKKLTAISPDDARPLTTMTLRAPLFVNRRMSLSQVLREMKQSKNHLALVCSGSPVDMRSDSSTEAQHPHGEILGCITLLDVVQRLVDERLDDDDSPRSTLSQPQVHEPGLSLLAAGRLRAWAQRARARRRVAEDSLRASLLTTDEEQEQEEHRGEP